VRESSRQTSEKAREKGASKEKSTGVGGGEVVMIPSNPRETLEVGSFKGVYPGKGPGKRKTEKKRLILESETSAGIHKLKKKKRGGIDRFSKRGGGGQKKGVEGGGRRAEFPGGIGSRH